MRIIYTLNRGRGGPKASIHSSELIYQLLGDQLNYFFLVQLAITTHSRNILIK